MTANITTLALGLPMLFAASASAAPAAFAHPPLAGGIIRRAQFDGPPLNDILQGLGLIPPHRRYRYRPLPPAMPSPMPSPPGRECPEGYHASPAGPPGYPYHFCDPGEPPAEPRPPVSTHSVNPVKPPLHDTYPTKPQPPAETKPASHHRLLTIRPKPDAIPPTVIHADDDLRTIAQCSGNHWNTSMCFDAQDLTVTDLGLSYSAALTAHFATSADLVRSNCKAPPRSADGKARQDAFKACSDAVIAAGNSSHLRPDDKLTLALNAIQFCFAGPNDTCAIYQQQLVPYTH